MSLFDLIYFLECVALVMFIACAALYLATGLSAIDLHHVEQHRTEPPPGRVEDGMD